MPKMLLTSRKTGRGIAARKSIASQFAKGNRMNRIIVLVFLLSTVGLVGACSSSNAPVQTNVNSNQNLNANSVPANTGVVTNNNGNENTSGVRPINANNSNQNQKPANKNQ